MPASSLTTWQRFYRRYLGSILFYPPAILIAFWLLHPQFGTGYYYSLLFTPFVTPLIVVCELFILAVFVFIPWRIAEDVVTHHRRHPWVRPLYLRCRERHRQRPNQSLQRTIAPRRSLSSGR